MQCDSPCMELDERSCQLRGPNLVCILWVGNSYTDLLAVGWLSKQLGVTWLISYELILGFPWQKDRFFKHASLVPVSDNNICSRVACSSFSLSTAAFISHFFSSMSIFCSGATMLANTNVIFVQTIMTSWSTTCTCTGFLPLNDHFSSICWTSHWLEYTRLSCHVSSAVFALLACR